MAGTAEAPRRLRGWMLLIVAIIAEVSGSLSLKGALTHPALYAVVVAGFLIAFTCLAGVLRAGISLGVAYSVWAAFGVALTAVLSVIIYAEPFSWLMGAGIIVIIAGVLCIELGAHAANRSVEGLDTAEGPA
ncbi:DMT family transporter [Brevibacterium luteolum]|uniref:DMT family transporter n=1 Tax=Brevibacterium luteolum TaxID=199591 RepID=UPI002699BC47